MGEMVDLMFEGFYNIDTFDELGMEPSRRKKNFYHNVKSDPFCYSRDAAICRNCGVRYDKLCVSVSLTAANARRDGWQIERKECWYEWYCPKCKAAHDFENVVSETTTATRQQQEA